MDKCDAPKLKKYLLDSNLGLCQGLQDELLSKLHDDEESIHFLCLMRDFRANLSLAENEDRQLWMDHIQVKLEKAKH